MSKTALILAAVAAVLAVQTCATTVTECKSGKKITSAVTLTNCDKPPCKLKKGTKVGVTLKFTPNHEIADPTVKLFASCCFMGMIKASIPGVDGTSVCGKIYKAADNSPADCPLKKGVEYVYKNEVPIESYYPSVSGKMHCALQENHKDILCYEVDAKIV